MEIVSMKYVIIGVLLMLFTWAPPLAAAPRSSVYERSSIGVVNSPLGAIIRTQGADGSEVLGKVAPNTRIIVTGRNQSGT